MELSREKAVRDTIGLRRLQNNIEPEDGQKYAVVTYVISNKVVDGFHGLWFFIGAYPTCKSANEKVEQVIKDYGIESTYSFPMCAWRRIDERFKPDRTILVGDDKKEIDNNLNSLIKNEQKRLKTEYETRQIMRDEISKDNEMMLDDTSVQYFTRKWNLLIYKYQELEKLDTMIKENTKIYEKMKKEIKELEDKYPEHKKSWLSILEDKLPKRGEKDLLDKIIKYHGLISE